MAVDPIIEAIRTEMGRQGLTSQDVGQLASVPSQLIHQVLVEGTWEMYPKTMRRILAAVGLELTVRPIPPDGGQ